MLTVPSTHGLMMLAACNYEVFLLYLNRFTAESRDPYLTEHVNDLSSVSIYLNALNVFCYILFANAVFVCSCFTISNVKHFELHSMCERCYTN